MNNVDFLSIVAVFQEMLGVWFWPLIISVFVVTVLFLWLLLREKHIPSRRFLWSELLGVPGGGVALVIMAKVSSSGFTDAGGPIDWIVILLIFMLGFIGTAILFYTLSGWLKALR